MMKNNDICSRCMQRDADVELLLSQNGKLQELLIKCEKELTSLRMKLNFAEFRQDCLEEVLGIGDS
jgi:hypothetical protein